MTANMCISVVWIEKKNKKSKQKSWPTEPFFSRHNFILSPKLDK